MEPWEQYSQPKSIGDEPWEQYGAPKQQPSQQSIGRTALDQGLQGATFGFADEATDRIGAGIASLATDENYGDLLNEARGISQERMRQQIQQNPGTAITANIAGALFTGGAGASTRAGTATANLLRSGGTAARIGKGAVAGAASGALYGAGAADDGQMLEGAKQGAIYGGITGGAIPAIGAAASAVKTGTKNAVTGAFARSPEALQDAADTMKAGASALYNKMRDVGAVLNPSSSNGLLATIDGKINQLGFIRNLNPKTTAILDDIAEHIQKNKGSIGLDKLDQYRRMLGRIGALEDGVSAGAAREAIDDIVDNLSNKSLMNGGEQAVKLLNKGRAEYARASRFDDVTDVLTKAEGDPNRIKAGLTRFLNNDRNIRGWSEQEISALRDAAARGNGEKLLRGLGTFGFDLGKVKNVALPGLATGAGYFAPGAIPLVAAGTAARQTGKYIGRGKAENLLRTIEGTAKSKASNIAVSPVLSVPAGELSANMNANLTREELIRQAMKLPPAEAKKLLQRK